MDSNSTIEEVIDKYVEIINEDKLICTRDWGAWMYGTMSEDDFIDCNVNQDEYERTVDDLKKFIKEYLKVAKLKEWMEL